MHYYTEVINLTGTQAAVGWDMLTTTETAADQHVTVESENDPGLEWTNRQMTVKQQQLLMRKRILNFYYIPLCLYNEFCNSIFVFSFSFFTNWDQIPNSYRVAPHSILQVVLVLIYGLKSSRILATSSVTYSNSLV